MQSPVYCQLCGMVQTSLEVFTDGFMFRGTAQEDVGQDVKPLC